MQHPDEAIAAGFQDQTPSPADADRAYRDSASANANERVTSINA
jgi:hypothetical protein